MVLRKDESAYNMQPPSCVHVSTHTHAKRTLAAVKGAPVPVKDLMALLSSKEMLYSIVIIAVVVFAPVKSQQINANNFVCPQGSQPYAGGASYTCRNAGDFCAIGFTCQPATPGSTTRATISGNLYCCSGVVSGSYCPRGGQPLIVPGVPGAASANGEQIAQTCSSGSCSFGYTCQQSSFGGLSYCCSNSLSGSNSAFNINNVLNNGNTNGYTPTSFSNTAFNNNNNGLANSNNIYRDSSIAVIRGDINNNANVAQPANYFCPGGATPWNYPGTQFVPTCLVGFSHCPNPSSCQSSTGSINVGTKGFCCIHPNN